MAYYPNGQPVQPLAPLVPSWQKPRRSFSTKDYIDLPVQNVPGRMIRICSDGECYLKEHQSTPTQYYDHYNKRMITIPDSRSK